MNIFGIIFFVLTVYLCISFLLAFLGDKIASGICALFGNKGDDTCKERVANILRVLAGPMIGVLAILGVKSALRKTRTPTVDVDRRPRFFRRP